MTFFDKFKSTQLIAAHRGYRSERPENTLSAFYASLGHCHFIELDIQMSKDLVPVVIHDPSLERTSNAAGLRRNLGIKSLRVSDWTLPQLKLLDVGSWFLTADPFGTIALGKVAPEEISRNLPQIIMTLEEVLLHPALQKIPVNIEIKEQTEKKQHTVVAETVVEVVKRSGATNRVLLSSFNHDYLVIAKTFAPKISLGVLQDHSHPPDLIEYIKTIGASAYHPSDTIVDARLVRRLRAAGIGVNVYTVNSKARQNELFAMGATAVFTDFPELT